MIRQLLITSNLVALVTMSLLGQTCTHPELSNIYNYVTNIKRVPYGDNVDSCIIKITVQNKLTKQNVQTLWLTSDFLLDDSAFVHCNNARSYITGVNGGMQVVNWDYGDIIVADFNFDDREDFAIKKEVGGNGGPQYVYYVQTIDSSFVQDKFLSDSLWCFPKYFNKDNKTLMTICRATSVMDVETVYKYDVLTNKWSTLYTMDINLIEIKE